MLTQNFGPTRFVMWTNSNGCLGATMIAAVGAGAFSGYEEACNRIVRFRDEITEPNAENQKLYELYAEKFQVFEKLYPANQALFSLCI